MRQKNYSHFIGKPIKLLIEEILKDLKKYKGPKALFLSSIKNNLELIDYIGSKKQKVVSFTGTVECGGGEAIKVEEYFSPGIAKANFAINLYTEYGKLFLDARYSTAQTRNRLFYKWVFN